MQSKVKGGKECEKLRGCVIGKIIKVNIEIASY